MADERRAEFEAAMEAHAASMEEPAFSGQIRRLEETIDDFLKSLTFGGILADRYMGREALWSAFSDNLVESAIAIRMLATDGMHNPLRRELRFVLESAIKYLVTDQQWDLTGGSQYGRPRTTADRIAWMTANLPRSSIEPVTDIAHQFPLQAPLDNAAFEQYADQLFGELCAYVHPSRQQMERRLAQNRRGATIGFETHKEWDGVNRIVERTLDVALYCFCNWIGASLSGDLFTSYADGDTGWRFHKTRWMRLVGVSFDYKSERKRAAGREGVGPPGGPDEAVALWLAELARQGRQP